MRIYSENSEIKFNYGNGTMLSIPANVLYKIKASAQESSSEQEPMPDTIHTLKIGKHRIQVFFNKSTLQLSCVNDQTDKKNGLDFFYDAKSGDIRYAIFANGVKEESETACILNDKVCVNIIGDTITLERWKKGHSDGTLTKEGEQLTHDLTNDKLCVNSMKEGVVFQRVIRFSDRETTVNYNRLSHQNRTIINDKNPDGTSSTTHMHYGKDGKFLGGLKQTYQGYIMIASCTVNDQELENGIGVVFTPTKKGDMKETEYEYKNGKRIANWTIKKRLYGIGALVVLGALMLGFKQCQRVVSHENAQGYSQKSTNHSRTA